MKTVNLLHLGIGNVGRALLSQIGQESENLKKHRRINLKYCGLFNSKGGIFNSHGLTKKEIDQFPENVSCDPQKAITKISPPFFLIDTTATEATFPLLMKALKKGGVILSNKKPLAASQKQFDILYKIGKERLLYETTVGAALPIVSTLKSLLSTGDEIIEIKGCFSGTLGFLFSRLEEGISFSKAVLEAEEKGYTEPDPRDDLSGLDVARKALILSRILGKKIELTDIKLSPLFPREMEKLSVSEFLKEVKRLDEFYKNKQNKAKSKRRTLRFVASINSIQTTVGLEDVEINSDLGRLKGPDNLILFRTKRYFNNPLIIKGPGAGVEVTASGVFNDILTISKMI